MKKININKKTIIIIISILLILIVLVIGKKIIFKKTPPVIPDIEVTTEEFPIKIKKIDIQEINKQEIDLNVTLLNDSLEKFKSRKMYIKFYQQDKLKYTYDYSIKTLDSYEELNFSVRLSFDFNYEDITRYDIIVDNKLLKVNK